MGLPPTHLPRPSRLQQPLEAPHQKVADALEALGLHTVGDLLWHLPRERRVARQIAELTPGEQANVLVEVRSITSRSVRRRGMKPLVEATVADQTGVMKVVFFNQPWLERRYRPGTRLALYGKYDGRNAFKVSSHSETADIGGSVEGIAHYAVSEGITSTQLAELVREHRAAIADVIEPLDGRLRVPRARCPTARRRSPTSTSARAPAAAGWPSTSCWPLSCCSRAGARCTPRSARPRWTARAS